MQLTSTDVAADPITGFNRAPRMPTDEVEALAQFYRAFNIRDLRLITQNWWNTDESTLISPLGGFARGWQNIRAFYERLFDCRVPLHVELHDYTLHINGSMFYAMGVERGFVVADDQRLDVEIRATRLFRLELGRWRQIHYHGSIPDTAMLHAYQQAMRSGT